MSSYFVKSEKGRDKLVSENFVYTFSKKTTNGLHSIWVCENRKLCCGRVWSKGETSEVVRVVRMHSHAAQAGRPEALNILTQCKERALNTKENVQQIISSAIETAHENVAALLPRKDVIKRSVRRIRNQNGVPPIPQNVEDLFIPKEYQEIEINGKIQQFLLYDTEQTYLPQRLMIFSTKENLNLLSKSDEWYADGTFSTVPSLFCQLYTIHVKACDTVLPVVYALLPNKTFITYKKFLQELKSLQPGLQPRKLVVDFEKAAIQAFEHAFPNIEITGCFFHLTQNIWRKVQSEGLQRQYQESHNFALWIRMLPALAFVPLDEVSTKFDDLVEHPEFPENAQSIVNYFEDTYIGRRGRRERRAPCFQPSLWNVHNRARANEHRTNNHVEGWHRSFVSTCGNIHPNIFKFIDALKKQQAIHNFDIIQFISGQRPARKNKTYERISNKIKKIVDDYHNRDIIDYLKGIAYNYEF